MSIVIKSGNSQDLAAVNSSGGLKVAANITGTNPVNIAEVNAAGQLKVALPTDIYGNLRTIVDPTIMFFDTFDGTVFDTTNRWLTYGSVAVGQAQGNASVNPGTTANATVAVASQPLILINSAVMIAGEITFEASPIATGNHRFWGLGSVTGNVGTAVLPLSDAVGFEVDVTGVLRASVYSNGVRTFTSILNIPTDGEPHLYAIQARGDVAFFHVDDFNVPVASTFTGPAKQNLPFRMHSLNSATVTGTPVMVVQGFAVADMARQSVGISDGVYPWRKVRVDAAGAVIVATSASAVTGNGPVAVPSSNSDTQLLAANVNRRGATIANDSTSVLYVSFGTNAASASAFTVKLAAAAYYEVPFGYTGAIRGIWASVNGNARVTEVVGP